MERLQTETEISSVFWKTYNAKTYIGLIFLKVRSGNYGYSSMVDHLPKVWGLGFDLQHVKTKRQSTWEGDAGL